MAQKILINKNKYILFLQFITLFSLKIILIYMCNLNLFGAIMFYTFFRLHKLSLLTIRRICLFKNSTIDL